MWLGPERPEECCGERQGGRNEGICPLWALRDISVTDLGQQGALLHTGPAGVSGRTVHSSVGRHVFLRVCTWESMQEQGLVSVCTPVCVCNGQCVSMCKFGIDMGIEWGQEPHI